MKNNQIDIIEKLKSFGIKPSYQRIKIYEYLVKKKNHPTTDMIYKELMKKIPTFSRTTVYNTMDLFIRKGIVSMISIDEREARFDANTFLHAHFLCDSCGNITDIPINPGEINIEGLKKFKIRENHINFRGLCSQCSAGENSGLN